MSRKPIQKKRRGRPRKRWKYSVYEDLQGSSIEHLKEKAFECEKWKEVTKYFMINVIVILI